MWRPADTSSSRSSYRGLKSSTICRDTKPPAGTVRPPLTEARERRDLKVCGRQPRSHSQNRKPWNSTSSPSSARHPGDEAAIAERARVDADHAEVLRAFDLGM